MKKRDLTSQKVIQTYIALADEASLREVTFPRIAERLGIKAPSLYNYFKNLSDLKVQTAIYLHTALYKRLTEELIGQNGGQALRTYALVYRKFANDYHSVYELLNTIPSFDNDELASIGRKNNQIITKILKSFSLSDKELLIKSRAFRSLLNGYIILKQLGYFQNDRLNDEESFSSVIDEFITSIS
ncbi:MAG: WHG domain-containing protein [Lentilactobacillus hilgardii]|nr:TetR/AcrR family transcriptional regulator [Lentilactobacillus hilgardii]MBZ2200421.1 TetR family transcriptional regulator [Lentilactobacillus hilgardii]MBZ2204273.1 TetR/AcrR family transcriptional regulator [Lentilactobacillus hilgardii]MCT3400770.1 TetR/AcrR family transcriptional regulator [Lentilactobacillus hilgardii]